MNRVSPIFEDENDSSADSFHRKLELRVTRATAPEQPSGPRTCRICLDEETAQAEAAEGEYNELEMVIPCECRGSVAYVHQKCIKMWIKKQLEGHKAKRAYCEICKAQILFKRIKIRYCDCTLSNLCDISPCNVVCVIAEIVIIAIVALIQYYVDRLMNFQLLRNALLALLAILVATFALTVVLIAKDTFVRTYKEIERIYSVEESERLGLKEPRSIRLTQESTKKRKKVGERTGRQPVVNTRPANHFQSISPQLILAFN